IDHIQTTSFPHNTRSSFHKSGEVSDTPTDGLANQKVCVRTMSVAVAGCRKSGRARSRYAVHMNRTRIDPLLPSGTSAAAHRKMHIGKADYPGLRGILRPSLNISCFFKPETTTAIKLLG